MSNSKLYVGNLSFKTTEDELRSAFGQFGAVTDVYVAMDKMTGRPRGFAFVTMGTAEEAKVAAEKMNGVDLGGRQLTVNEARPKEERPFLLLVAGYPADGVQVPDIRRKPLAQIAAFL